MSLRSRPMHRLLRTTLLLSLPLLSACEQPPPPQPATQTIRGQLPGYPNPGPAYAGAKVMIPGHAPVTPDASGVFEIPGVQTPYDLVVHYPAANGTGFVVLVQGLQRNDPTLPANYSATRRAQVSGTFSGPSFPLPAGRKLAVVFETPLSIGAQGTFTESTYSHEVTWPDAESMTGTLHAMELGTDPSTGQQTYGAYGRREGVTLTQGSALSGQDIALSPIGTASITGRVTDIPGQTLQKTSVTLEIANERGMSLFSYSPATSDFQLAVPDLAGATFKVQASLSGRGDLEYTQVWKTGVRAGTTDLVLTAPAPTRLLSPASKAQVDDLSAGFSWEGPPRALYQFDLLASVGGEPHYQVIQVITTETHVTVPDLSPLGLTASRRGASYSWMVSAYGPVESVEEWMWFTPRPSESRFSSGSGLSSFTTAP
ncbi:hypothetical protein NR798_11420 [Archangium gephyra]|uniref:hypothetical protein n=1 Tax=Archangium gephyra TaxID=48 RepID=UPI0035D496E8